MKPTDPDRELTRLKEATDNIAANLVELEIDSSRRLLEASTLSGESAALWSAASAALTDLWACRALLEGLLERAQELARRPRRAEELHALLTGPSIELARGPVPLADRDLLAGPEQAVRCTADELLLRMSGAFDEVKTAVARFGQAWETLTPGMSEARAVLGRAQALAAALGESDRAGLRDAAGRITDLTARLRTDPLAVAPGEIDRLIASLQATARELEATAALRRELDARLAEARIRLTQLDALLDEGKAAHQELLIKIAVPSAPAPPPDEPSELSGELDQIAGLAGSGEWHEARRRFDDWTKRIATALEHGERVLHANRAPLEARNQLRALLEAYQVKAGRLGAIEDPQLQRVFAQAHGALYTAPTDLALAAQLVRRYQETLNAPGEVLR